MYKARKRTETGTHAEIRAHPIFREDNGRKGTTVRREIIRSAIMRHASLRFGDTKTIESLELGKEQIEGKLSAPKITHKDTKKFFCPVQGFTSNSWSDPIVRYRDSYRSARSYPPSFLFPEVAEDGKKILEPSAKKTAVLKTFRKMLTEAGEAES